MCLNALEAPFTVEYTTKGSSISVNGAEINFGASVPHLCDHHHRQGADHLQGEALNSGEYTIELGEKLYKDLKLVKDTTDAFERPAHEWYAQAPTIGTYAEAADLEYTLAVKVGTIYSDLGLARALTSPRPPFMRMAGIVRLLTTQDIVKGEGQKGGNGTCSRSTIDDDAESLTRDRDQHLRWQDHRCPTRLPPPRDVLRHLYCQDRLRRAYETDDSYSKDDIVLYTYSSKAGDVWRQSWLWPRRSPAR